MTVSNLYETTVRSLASQHALETKGFQRAMRSLIERYVLATWQHIPEEVDIDGTLIGRDIQGEVDAEMEEWFGEGEVKIRPAAYRIVDNGSLSRPEVHIYEIAFGRRVPLGKLETYGMWADVDPGLDLTLHIVNENGQELVLPCHIVMRFWSMDPYETIREFVAQESAVFAISNGKSKADKPLPNGVVPTEKQKRDAAYRAVRELGIKL